MTVQGTVTAVLPRGMYRVRTEDGREVLATVSTQARRVLVRIIEGDRVAIQRSSYDPARAQIIGKS